MSSGSLDEVPRRHEHLRASVDRVDHRVTTALDLALRREVDRIHLRLAVGGEEGAALGRHESRLEQGGGIGLLDLGEHLAVFRRAQHGDRRAIDGRVRVEEDREIGPDPRRGRSQPEQDLHHRHRRRLEVVVRLVGCEQRDFAATERAGIERRAVEMAQVRIAGLAAAAREVDLLAGLVDVDDVEHRPVARGHRAEEIGRAVVSQLVEVEMPQPVRSEYQSTRRSSF